MTMPGAVPTIDVTEADRRLREDPDRPILVDVREPGEFATVRARGAMLVPTSTFMARMADLPTDRPLLDSPTWAVGRPRSRRSCSSAVARTWPTWPAAWRRGSEPASRSGAAAGSRARATSQADLAAARPSHAGARPAAAPPFGHPMVERANEGAGQIDLSSPAAGAPSGGGTGARTTPGSVPCGRTRRR